MIHLINMPFGQITYPSLALGLIKAQLNRAKLDSKIFYLNFDLAASMGFEPYSKISLANVQIGEWLFAGDAWKNHPPLISLEDFLQLYDLKLPQDLKQREKLLALQKVRSNIIPGFLAESLEQLESAGKLQIIGFSCTYFQTLSSLALGRLIKEKYPDTKLVYGGAAFHGEMGVELIEKCEWIDVVSVGEIDDIVVELFQSLAKKELPIGLQGIFYRNQAGKVCHEKPGSPVSQEIFEALPVPDFTDFFKAVSKFGLSNDAEWQRRAVIPFETSRGCWWGQKKQCRFCGLNGNNIGYRKKSAEQVCHNLAQHFHKYPVRSFYATDNNLAMSAFDDIIPELTKNHLIRMWNYFFLSNQIRAENRSKLWLRQV